MLLKNIHVKSAAQQETLFFIICPILTNDATNVDASLSVSDMTDELKYLLDHFLDIIMYTVPHLQKSEKTPSVSYGLSSNFIKFVTHGGRASWSNNAVELQKLKVFFFLN
jgi:hypothetical protein